LLYLLPYSTNLNLMALRADAKRHRALVEVSQAQGGT
jgi:hypothetical protein